MRIISVLFILLSLSVLQEPHCQSTDTNITHMESLVYNPVARAARVEGDVVLEVHISQEGIVTDVLNISGHPTLFRNAEENIRKWKFNPGKKRIVRLSYRFRLQEPAVYENVPANLIVDWPDRVSVTGNISPRILD